MTTKIIPVPKQVKRDLTGNRFGRWTVVGYAGRKSNGAGWLCTCDCGNQKIVASSLLTRGESQSCGCLRREMPAPAKRHGMSDSPEYHIWRSMKQRCDNPRRKDYSRYGGRGIRVCERWLKSFESFLADIGSRPSPKHSLDRIDNDGDYEPGNCRWATPSEQSNNVRTNHYLTYQGESLTVAQWAKRTGIAHNTISYRLSKGWPVERVLTEPVNDSQRR